MKLTLESSYVMSIAALCGGDEVYIEVPQSEVSLSDFAGRRKGRRVNCGNTTDSTFFMSLEIDRLPYMQQCEQIMSPL